MVLLVSLVAALVLAFTHVVGLWRTIKRSAQLPVGLVVWGIVSFLAWLAVLVVLRRVTDVRSGDAWVHHFYVLVVVGLPLMGLILAGLLARRPPREHTLLVVGWIGAGLMVLPAALGVWATYVEPERLRVDRVDVSTGEEPVGEGGIRIGVVADVQTDWFGEYEHDAVAAMLAEEPDLIVVAGDITQLEWDDYLDIKEAGIATLSMLDAPFGVYSVQGNTDPGPLEFADFSRKAGMTPLLDEAIEIDVRGRTVRLGGLAWPNHRRPAAAALAEEWAAAADPGSVDVLLSHSPDGVSNLADASAFDLVISGHTHGGQVKLPFIGPLWNATELPRDVAAGGLHEVRGAPVYVSTGVGVQRGDAPRVRFRVRPSIGVLTIP